MAQVAIGSPRDKAYRRAIYSQHHDIQQSQALHLLSLVQFDDRLRHFVGIPGAENALPGNFVLGATTELTSPGITNTSGIDNAVANRYTQRQDVARYQAITSQQNNINGLPPEIPTIPPGTNDTTFAMPVLMGTYSYAESYAIQHTDVELPPGKQHTPYDRPKPVYPVFDQWTQNTLPSLLSIESPVGVSSYDLPVLGKFIYQHISYQVQDFVLTSASQPEGKQLTELLGYDSERLRRLYAAIESQSQQLQLQGNALNSILPSGIQSYELPPHEASRAFQTDIISVLDYRINEPQVAQFTDYNKYSSLNISRKTHEAINAQWQQFGIVTEETVLTVGIQYYDLPVIGKFVFQHVHYQVPNFVLTSAPQPDGKQQVELLGYDTERIRRLYVAIESQAQQLQLQGNALNGVPVGVQSTDYARPPLTSPIFDQWIQNLLPVQIVTLPVGIQYYDNPGRIPSLISDQWIQNVIREIGIPEGKQIYDLPVVGKIVSQHVYYQVPEFILTSADKPDGKQLTTAELPGRNEENSNKHRIAIISTDKLGSPLAILISVAPESANGRQSHHTVRAYSVRTNQRYIAVRSQSEQLQVQNFVLTSGAIPDGKQYHDLPVRDTARALHVEPISVPYYVLNEPAVQQFTDYNRYSNTILSRKQHEAINAQWAQLGIVTEESVLTVGVQSFELPPRGPERRFQTDIFCVQNFVLISADQPEGKQQTNLLGYDQEKINRAHIALRSQFEQLQTQGNALNSILPVGTSTYDVPRGRENRYYLETVNSSILTVQIGTLPAGTHLYDLPPRGALRPLHIDPISVPDYVLNEPLIAQSTELPPRGFVRQYQTGPFIVQNFVLTSAGIPGGKQLTTAELPGRNENDRKLRIVSILSTDKLGTPTAILASVVTNLAVGIQIYDVLGWDIDGRNRRYIAVRSQFEQLQVQDFVLTSPSSTDGKSVYDLPPRDAARALHIEPISVPDYVLNEPLIVQFTDYSPYAALIRTRKTHEAINAQWSQLGIVTEETVVTAGVQSYDLPPRGRENRYYLEQVLSSVLGVQISTLPAGNNHISVPNRVLTPPIQLIYQNTLVLEIVGPVGKQWLDLRIDLPRRFQTDINPVREFILTSADQPVGKQLITAELPGRNDINSKQHRIAISTIDVVGMPLALRTVVFEDIPYGDSIYDVLGYDIIKTSKTHVSLRAQFEQRQIPNFALTSANPFGTQIYENPTRVLTRALDISPPGNIALPNTPPPGVQSYVVPAQKPAQHYLTDSTSSINILSVAPVGSAINGYMPPARIPFQTDIYGVPEFILTSAAPPEGDQLTTAELPGRNDLNDNKYRIALMGLDVLGMPLPILNIASEVLPEGKAITDVLGYNENDKRKKYVATLSESESIQIPEFVLTSAAQPEGKQTYVNPVLPRVPSRHFEQFMSQAILLETVSLPNGARSYDLPVIEWRRSYRTAINAQSYIQRADHHRYPDGKQLTTWELLNNNISFSNKRYAAVRSQAEVRAPHSELVPSPELVPPLHSIITSDGETSSTITSSGITTSTIFSIGPTTSTITSNGQTKSELP